MIDWQPIETAPKARARILASHWSGYFCDWIMDAEYKDGKWLHGLSYLSPTHWYPMPESPAKRLHCCPFCGAAPAEAHDVMCGLSDRAFAVTERKV